MAPGLKILKPIPNFLLSIQFIVHSLWLCMNFDVYTPALIFHETIIGIFIIKS